MALDNTQGSYGGDQTGSTVNRSGVQWWKLQVNSTGTPLTYSASGMVYDNATSNPYWYCYPSLAVNASAVMVVGFSGSKSTEYVGAFYTGRMSDGTMLGRPVLIQAGRSYYSADNRWGDYSYTTLDPSDTQTAIWTVQSYTDIDPAIGWGIWATWITSVKPGP